MTEESYHMLVKPFLPVLFIFLWFLFLRFAANVIEKESHFNRVNIIIICGGLAGIFTMTIGYIADLIL